MGWGDLREPNRGEDLERIVDAVADGGVPVTVRRNGLPVAVVVGLEDWEAVKAEADLFDAEFGEMAE